MYKIKNVLLYPGRKIYSDTRFFDIFILSDNPLIDQAFREMWVDKDSLDFNLKTNGWCFNKKLTRLTIYIPTHIERSSIFDMIHNLVDRSCDFYDRSVDTTFGLDDRAGVLGSFISMRVLNSEVLESQDGLFARDAVTNFRYTFSLPSMDSIEQILSSSAGPEDAALRVYTYLIDHCVTLEEIILGEKS